MEIRKMNCLFCNKETDNDKFCSKSCSAKVSNVGRNRHGTTYNQCKNCTIQLIRSDATFCSIPCQHTYRRNIHFQNGTATSVMLKTYLLDRYGAKCSLCGWDKINPSTKKCPIELDHIDGNSSNNSKENGRLICPSCHSLQPTYKALNKGKGRFSRMQRYHTGKSY